MTKPLFTWAGGKNKMITKYKEAELFPSSVDSYIEPFFGGGAMYIHVKKNNPNAKCIINDINPSIVAIYESIKSDYKTFCDVAFRLEEEYMKIPAPIPYSRKAERKIETAKSKEVEGKYKYNYEYEEDGNKKSFIRYDWNQIHNEHPTRRSFYFKVRDQLAWKSDSWSKTFEAGVLYFLMKTGFNGVWQVNRNTNNKFGTPFGLGNQKTKVYDRDVLNWWHQALQDTVILSMDYESVVKEWAKKDSFIFMDPPYRDSFTQYDTDFNDNEQERVIKCLQHCKDIGALGWLSNRDCGDNYFEDRWDKDDIKYFDVTYTVGRRKKTGTKKQVVVWFGFKKEIEKEIFEAKQAREVLLITK